MNAHLEIEYKVLLEADQFKACLDAFPQATTRHQINHYFHYGDPSVRVVARIRTVDKQSTLTFKLDSEEGLLEYDFPLDGSEASPFKRTDVQVFLRDHRLLHEFTSLGDLETIRHAIMEATQEICLDENHYEGVTDYELEVEATLDASQAHRRFVELCHAHNIPITHAPSKYARFLKQKRP